MGLRQTLSARAVAAALAIAATAGCDASGRVAGVHPPNNPSSGSRYPGFDIAVYPGDAALSAWRFPTSPYYWVGYYLDAPCHRDATWMGTYRTVTGMGWGTALIYVGQQDWSQIPNEIEGSRLEVLGLSFEVERSRERLRAAVASRTSNLEPLTSNLAVTCSASLLTTAQGTAEAADAVTKAQREGFPAGSAIFLDVEFVTAVTQPLLDYVTAWAAGVLADGRYVPAIYAAKSNAPTLYQSVLNAFAAARHSDTPKFWIASSTGFSLTSDPTDVGLPYAAVWQGRFDVPQSWGGIGKTIDVDVASTPSPSAPPQ